MVLLGWLLVGAGLVVCVLGFDLPDRLESSWGSLVACLAPVAILSSIIGVLLINVPEFFSSAPENARVESLASPRNLESP